MLFHFQLMQENITGLLRPVGKTQPTRKKTINRVNLRNHTFSFGKKITLHFGLRSISLHPSENNKIAHLEGCNKWLWVGMLNQIRLKILAVPVLDFEDMGVFWDSFYEKRQFSLLKPPKNVFLNHYCWEYIFFSKLRMTRFLAIVAPIKGQAPDIT